MSLLEDGDVLWGPGDGLILEPEPTHREPDLERRAVDDWNHTGPMPIPSRWRL